MATLHLVRLGTRHVGPIDLTVAGGECVTLAGPSGAGKSLLLRAIADLDPHTGEARLDERRAAALRPAEWRRRVGYLAAESHWWADRVGDHFAAVEVPLWASLGFAPEAADWQVARLSTGERQRLALLRLLANAPEVLLLDEPTASLDADNVARAEAIIADYRRRRGTAVLWVSHDPAQARRVADRQLRMRDGRLEGAA